MGRKRNPSGVEYTPEEQELLTKFLLAQMTFFNHMAAGVRPFGETEELKKQAAANIQYARHAIGAIRFMIDQVPKSQYHLVGLPAGGV